MVLILLQAAPKKKKTAPKKVRGVFIYVAAYAPWFFVLVVASGGMVEFYLELGASSFKSPSHIYNLFLQKAAPKKKKAAPKKKTATKKVR